jgi:hypothetical protein
MLAGEAMQTIAPRARTSRSGAASADITISPCINRIPKVGKPINTMEILAELHLNEQGGLWPYPSLSYQKMVGHVKIQEVDVFPYQRFSASDICFVFQDIWP